MGSAITFEHSVTVMVAALICSLPFMPAMTVCAVPIYGRTRPSSLRSTYSCSHCLAKIKSRVSPNNSTRCVALTCTDMHCNQLIRLILGHRFVNHSIDISFAIYISRKGYRWMWVIQFAPITPDRTYPSPLELIDVELTLRCKECIGLYRSAG